LQEPEKLNKSIEQEEKMKAPEDDLARRQEQLNKPAE
jgi:hypothetical protein